MDAFIRCLNANSSVVIAIASAISAVATIFIAWFSYVSSRLLRWEKEKDRRSRQPVLSFVDEFDERGNCRNLYVKNVGYGPAMDVVRTIIHAGDLVKTTPNEPLLIGCLGPGEKVYAYCATPPNISSVPIIDDPMFQASLEYGDILGNPYEIRYQQRHHSIPRLIEKRRILWDQVARI